MIDRRHFTVGCGCCGLLASLSSLAWDAPPRFTPPDPATDEGGLWALMDREEARLKRSHFLMEPKELQQYVAEITCRLAGEHCPDVRVYLVRTPYFNASMAPNGMLQLWSGLLLRMANEAQLAAIIGHELGHYLARHSVEQLRDAKSRAAFGQFLGIILSAGGAGGVALGTLSQLAIVAGMFAYSREHEIQADEIGLELMSGAGYAPQEAPRIWQQLVDEYKGDPENETTAGSVLFATHPAPSDRLTNLAELAKKMPSAGQIGESAFGKVLFPVRFDLLKDEMKRRRPSETLVLLDRLIGITPGDADLLFFRGEAYRMRNQSGDLEKALESYKYSIDSKRPPAESYRSMGLIQRKIGQPEAARQSFSIYLRLRPDAEDSDLIRSYLEEGS